MRVLCKEGSPENIKRKVLTAAVEKGDYSCQYMAEQVLKNRANCPCSEKLSTTRLFLVELLHVYFFLKQIGFPVLQNCFLTKIKLTVCQQGLIYLVRGKAGLLPSPMPFNKGFFVSLHFIQNVLRIL